MLFTKMEFANRRLTFLRCYDTESFPETALGMTSMCITTVCI
jgi:hypothetical protein